MSQFNYFFKQLESRGDKPLRVTKSQSDMIAKNYVRHEWQLKRYPMLPIQECESACFSAPGSVITWSLLFKPYVWNYREACVQIDLKPNSFDCKARIFYGFEYLDVDGNGHRITQSFEEVDSSSQFRSVPLKSEISVEKKTLSTDGTLTLACFVFEFEYKANPYHLQVCYSSSEKKAHGLLEQLLEKCTSSFGDTVTLVGKDDVGVDANQFILAARSAVLQAKLNSPTKELGTRVIKLEDIDGEVLKRMVDFINTDAVSDLNEFAEPLLVVADRYQLMKLKMLCEEHLIQLVGLSTVSHLKSLAERTNAPILAKSCKVFSGGNQSPNDPNEEPSLKKCRQ